jgi:hypothetical protein
MKIMATTILPSDAPITSIEAAVIEALRSLPTKATVGSLIQRTDLDPFTLAEALSGLMDKHLVVLNDAGEYTLAHPAGAAKVITDSPRP